MRCSVMLAGVILIFSGSVLAASSDAIQLDMIKGSFPQQQDSILKAINTDVDYSEISATDRALVNQSLSSIAGKLNGSQSLASIGAEIQQQILSEQKIINDSLIQAKKDSRMICKREMVLGSKLDKKVCRTAASMKRENDAIRDAAASGTSKIK